MRELGRVDPENSELRRQLEPQAQDWSPSAGDDRVRAELSDAKTAKSLGRDPEEYRDLARDPAHAGRIDEESRRERDAVVVAWKTPSGKADIGAHVSGATPKLTTSGEVNVSRLAEQGWSTEEATIITRSQSILESPEFQTLHQAFAGGKEQEVSIDGVTIIYGPELPPGYSGMTLFGENGFMIGPSAFASQTETEATVLQEMYRLTTSSIGPSGGVKVGAVAEETATAQAWADRAVMALQPK